LDNQQNSLKLQGSTLRINNNDGNGESINDIKVRPLASINYQNAEEKRRMRASSQLFYLGNLTNRSNASTDDSSSLKLTGTSFNKSINKLLKEEKLKDSSNTIFF
jgi:hypothetical protein